MSADTRAPLRPNALEAGYFSALLGMTRKALTLMLTALVLSPVARADTSTDAKQILAKATAAADARRAKDAELAEAKRAVTAACEVLSTPASPEEVAIKNELASMLWSGRVGIKVASASDLQAVGQALRDLTALNYDWARLDSRAQVAEFSKRVSNRKFGPERGNRLAIRAWPSRLANHTPLYEMICPPKSMTSPGRAGLRFPPPHQESSGEDSVFASRGAARRMPGWRSLETKLFALARAASAPSRSRARRSKPSQRGADPLLGRGRREFSVALQPRERSTHVGFAKAKAA